MYYDIIVNENKVGTFGHPDIENVSYSVSGGPDGMYVFASAVCLENNKRYHYFWIQKDILLTDSVLIKPSVSKESDLPIKKVEMGQSKKSTPEDVFCDFCKRKETEHNRIIAGGGDRPSICAECIELCETIIKDKSV